MCTESLQFPCVKVLLTKIPKYKNYNYMEKKIVVKASLKISQAVVIVSVLNCKDVMHVLLLQLIIIMII